MPRLLEEDTIDMPTQRCLTCWFSSSWICESRSDSMMRGTMSTRKVVPVIHAARPVENRSLREILDQSPENIVHGGLNAETTQREAKSQVLAAGSAAVASSVLSVVIGSVAACGWRAGSRDDKAAAVVPYSYEYRTSLGFRV